MPAPSAVREVTEATSAGAEAPAVYLIGGPAAAGKTTVARLLAARFERGVRLDGDRFRRTTAAADALEQLRLGCRLAAAAVDGHVDTGATVVLEDRIAGRLLGDYRTLIRSRPCHVIALVPSREAVVARAAGRSGRDRADRRVERLYEEFVGTTPRVGLWLDTTALTPDETVAAILAGTSSDRSPIIVTDYDPAWPATFAELAGRLREALADLGELEHVGSTAVPGLAAKPVVDIDVVVRSPADVPAAIERLRAVGYVYQGDKGIAGREAFMWPAGARPHHLYVVVAGSKPHADHVELRDYLRGHPDVADEYAALKRRLAERHAGDRLGYTDAKAEFIAGVLAQARG